MKTSPCEVGAGISGRSRWRLPRYSEDGSYKQKYGALPESMSCQISATPRSIIVVLLFSLRFGQNYSEAWKSGIKLSSTFAASGLG